MHPAMIMYTVKTAQKARRAYQALSPEQRAAFTTAVTGAGTKTLLGIVTRSPLSAPRLAPEPEDTRWALPTPAQSCETTDASVGSLLASGDWGDRVPVDLTRAVSALSAPIDRIALQRPMDTANVGGFGLSLYNVQLIVSTLGDAHTGGEYDVGGFHSNDWTILIGRDGTPLSLIVRADATKVTVQTVDPEAHQGPAATPTR